MDIPLDVWNLWLRNIIHQKHYGRHPVRFLCTPAIKSKTYGGRAVSTAAPQLWNTIPEYVKNADGVATFKIFLCLH